MSRATKVEAKRALELLRSEAETPASIAARTGASKEAVDEARCLLDDIDTAEVDAILAMPPVLARGLLRAATEAGRQEILAEAALHGNKEIQKEAKRLAHHLRLRGVEVELPEKEGEAPRAEAPLPSPELPVLLSLIDPEGTRRMFWTENVPGRGVELADLWCGDDEVRAFSSTLVSRKQLRSLVSEIPKDKPTFFLLGREEGKRYLDRLRVSVRKGARSPPEFPAWALHALGPIPEEPPAPLAPTGEGASPDDPEEVARLALASPSLFDEPELVGWIPEESILRSLALRVEEARSSPLYLPGERGDVQRDEAIAAAIEREAEAYFDPRRRERYARRLLEVARLFEIGEKKEAARIAAATSLRLREGAPLAEVPFALAFLRRLFRRRPWPEETPPPAGPILLP